MSRRAGDFYGAIGAHSTAASNAYEDFQILAKKIARCIKLTIP